MEYFLEIRWSPYGVGIGIGILSWLSFLLAKKPIACSTSFAKTSGLIERLIRGRRVESKPYYQEIRLDVDWQWMLVAGIFIGACISALLSGDFHWRWIPAAWESAFGNSTSLRIIAAVVGGIFLGVGARWADGCTSGHGISGTMQLVLSSWVSAISFFVGGIIAAHILFKLIG